MNKSSRDVGTVLERRISNLLDLELTRGSGSTLHDADLKDKYILVECKVKGGVKGSTLPASHLKKVRKAARDFHRKWAYIVENGNKDTLVTIDLPFFKELYEAWKDSVEPEDPDFCSEGLGG